MKIRVGNNFAMVKIVNQYFASISQKPSAVSYREDGFNRKSYEDSFQPGITLKQRGFLAQSLTEIRDCVGTFGASKYIDNRSPDEDNNIRS